MIKVLPVAAACLLGLSTFAFAAETSPPAPGTAPSAQNPEEGARSTAGSGGSTMPTEEQVMENLKSQGLRNIHLQKEPQGWTAHATTPDYRPVTIRIDERGNVLGGRTY
jgi:hypothetical protein